jgi:hypothetical protein
MASLTRVEIRAAVLQRREFAAFESRQLFIGLFQVGDVGQQALMEARQLFRLDPVLARGAMQGVEPLFDPLQALGVEFETFLAVT